MTALMCAAQAGRLEVVASLVKRGASINKERNVNVVFSSRDSSSLSSLILVQDGWTALMLAVVNGHIDVINMLFERGAVSNFEKQVR